MDGRKLRRLDALAFVLDELVRVPGTRIRIGLDALLGLVPGLGDIVAGVAGAYALVVAERLGAPPSVLARMAGNVLVDLVLGAIPVLGDLFDIGWKANRRNVRLLMAYRAAPGAVSRDSTLVLIAALGAVLAVVVLVGWLTVLAFRWLAQSGA